MGREMIEEEKEIWRGMRESIFLEITEGKTKVPVSLAYQLGWMCGVLDSISGISIEEMEKEKLN